MSSTSTSLRLRVLSTCANCLSSLSGALPLRCWQLACRQSTHMLMSQPWICCTLQRLVLLTMRFHPHMALLGTIAPATLRAYVGMQHAISRPQEAAPSRARTWKGRILPVARSKATASQSRTTDCVPSLSTPGSTAAMSGYFTVMFSLLRLQRHRPQEAVNATSLTFKFQ